MSLEKEHPRNLGNPRCEHCNVLLVGGEVVTCDPCACALVLDLARNERGLRLIHGNRWEQRREELLSKAQSLRDGSLRPSWHWTGVEL